MKQTILILLILTALIFYTCTKDVAGTNDETVTGTTAIMLYGKVLDIENKGVANVVVQLSTTGFGDTTNSEGIYQILASEDTIIQLGLNLDTLQDTVEYFNNNSLITTANIVNWIDTLPDVYIIQRNVSGSLLTTYTQFKRVEAVLKNLDDSTVAVKSEDLWLSTNTFNYSGYLYFLNNAGVQHYSLYVNIYNKDSIFVGRSATETFPSTAGDILLAPFDPFNAVPTVNAGSDFTVSINDTIALYGSVIDSFGGTVAKWEWDIGNTGVFVESLDSTFSTIAPITADSAYNCILKVTDNDGNIVFDTVVINVQEDAPICSASTTTPMVSINDTILLQGTATDAYGTIIKWEWDAGNTGIFIETSPESSYTTIAPSIPDTAYQCVLKVTDNDSNITFDTVTINVILDVPSCTATTTTPTVSINDTIQLQGTSTDTYGTIVKWEWDVGNTGVFVETTPESSYTTIALSTADSVYPCILKVTDNDANVVTDTITILVVKGIPVATILISDTAVNTNTPITLEGTADPNFGEVIKWEWDIGNTGTFEEYQDSMVTFTTPSKPTLNYKCILKVTDDDENTIKDTICFSVGIWRLIDSIWTKNSSFPQVSTYEFDNYIYAASANIRDLGEPLLTFSRISGTNVEQLNMDINDSLLRYLGLLDFTIFNDTLYFGFRAYDKVIDSCTINIMMFNGTKWTHACSYNYKVAGAWGIAGTYFDKSGSGVNSLYNINESLRSWNNTPIIIIKSRSGNTYETKQYINSQWIDFDENKLPDLIQDTATFKWDGIPIKSNSFVFSDGGVYIGITQHIENQWKRVGQYIFVHTNSWSAPSPAHFRIYNNKLQFATLTGWGLLTLYQLE